MNYRSLTFGPGGHRPASTRDYQRSKVYRWEEGIESRRVVLVREMSLGAIRDLGSRIWRELGWTTLPPRVMGPVVRSAL